MPDRRPPAASRRLRAYLHWPAWAIGAAILPGPALAQVNVGLPLDAADYTWDLGPGVVLLALIALGLYVAGVARLRGSPEAPGALRHWLYVFGVAVAFLSVASPVGPLGDRNFFDREIQSMLLRMLAPMLIVLAAPWEALAAGTPGWARRVIFAPAGSPQRRLFAGLYHPVTVTFLFVGVLYVWHLPVLNDAVLQSGAVENLMLASILVTGLLFFGRVLDRRPAPPGLRHGPRLFMAVLVMMAQILIGAFLAFKETVIYPLYDQIGRLGVESPLYDESLGGIVVWIPSICIMTLVMILIMRHWGRHDTHGSEVGGVAVALTSADLRTQVAAQNRTLAVGFIVMVLGFFAVTMSVGIISVMMGH